MPVKRERFDGAAAWDKLTPESQARIGAAALEYIVNWNGQDAYSGPDLTPQARPFETADALLQDELLEAAQEALREHVPAIFDDNLPIPVPSLLGPVCRVCGCSEYDTCGEGCRWADAERTLCTACVSKEEQP